LNGGRFHFGGRSHGIADSDSLLNRIVNWLRPEDIEGITSREELIETLRIRDEPIRSP
jgi:hypothetical protein